MKPIHVLLKTPLTLLTRSLGLLLLGLLLTQQGWAQIYAAPYTSSDFKYFDIPSNTWTNKASAPEALVSLAVYQGEIYAHARNTTNFYLYDPVTDTWTAKTSSSSLAPSIVTAGDFIYLIRNNVFEKYNPATDFWTTLSNVGLSSGATSLAYDGGDFLYVTEITLDGGVSTLKRYSISGDTWTAMPTPPAQMLGACFKNGILYCFSLTSTLYSFNPGTSTYTQLNNPLSADNLISGESNYLYSVNSQGNNFQRYDISTNTWTTYATPGTNYYAMAYLGGCSLTASVTATPATCAGTGGANANAALTLSNYAGGATKVGYSTGSSYTGPDFATATAMTAAPMVISNTLANPTVDQPYTIRVFKDETCYLDVVSVLKPQICLTSDISVAVSPLSQTAASGEIQTYTVTVTNAGPDPSAVKLRVPLPVNRTLLSASPQQGTYSESTQIWDVGNLPVGSKTLTLSIKVN